MEYIKKAEKTAAGNSDRIRGTVKEILADIEQRGEEAVTALAKKI